MSGPCGVWTRAKCTFCLSLTQADNSSIIYCPGSVQLQRPAAGTKESLTLCPALDSAAASICFVNNSPLCPKRGIIYSGLRSFCSDQGFKEKTHCSSESLEGIRVEGGMDNALCPHLGGAESHDRTAMAAEPVSGKTLASASLPLENHASQACRSEFCPRCFIKEVDTCPGNTHKLPCS